MEGVGVIRGREKIGDLTKISRSKCSSVQKGGRTKAAGWVE